MSRHTMPMILLNCGAEMFYILAQRLHAQNVPLDKSRRVLVDVVRTMFNSKFVTEMFRPQEMYSSRSTRQIFEKIAHSSIMKLNRSSMDKLYDLMLMGFKYQLLLCTSPQHLLQVTLRHLESIREAIAGSFVEPLVNETIDMTIEKYTALSFADWIALRQRLLLFLQDRNVKVSLLLQSDLQTVDGVIVLQNKGVLPANVEQPGLMRLVDAGMVVSARRFEHPCAGECRAVETYFDPRCALGTNMYMRRQRQRERQERVQRNERGAGSKDADSSSSANAEDGDDDDNDGLPTQLTSAMIRAGDKLQSSMTGSSRTMGGSKTASPAVPVEDIAAAELSLLAQLVGGGPTADSKGGDNNDDENGAGDKGSDSMGTFRINLFPDDGSSSSREDGASDMITIDIDAVAEHKSFAHLMDELNLNDDGGSPSCSPGRRAEAKHSSGTSSASPGAGSKGGEDGDGDGDEDDLLALMDGVK